MHAPSCFNNLVHGDPVQIKAVRITESLAIRHSGKTANSHDFPSRLIEHTKNREHIQQ